MSTLHRARTWLTAHPLALDATLALGVLVAMIAGCFVDPNADHGDKWGARTPDALSITFLAPAAALLVVRRRAPLAVLAATCALTLAELVTGDPRAPVAMSAVIALYTVASTTDRPTTWRVGLLTMTVLTGTAMLVGPLPWYAQENIGIFAWTGMAATAGDAVRSRRAFVHAIRERADRAERTREEEARRRVAEERLRIARDLHDVVAHHIALVNVQAGVAAHVMDKRPDQAKEALAHVREASRSALNELRATVGLLRQSGDPEAPTEPAPGLLRLDELVGTFHSAGLAVKVVRADEGVSLPAAVDLAAYRVIQEALTNVHKHAGEAAKAEVSVVRVGPNVEITVLDNGSGRPTTAGHTCDSHSHSRDSHTHDNHDNHDRDSNTRTRTRTHPDHPEGGGHGLLGMRERVSALGGVLSTGPRYGGGFRVHAILPLKTRSTTAEAVRP